MAHITIWDHALALCVGLLLPVGSAVQQRRARERVALTTEEKLSVYWGNSAVLALLAALTLLVWAVLGERPLAGLGLTAPVRVGAGSSLAAAFVLLYAADTWFELGPARLDATRRRWREQTPFMPATARELVHSLAMVVSAAVFEEIVFRGYLIAYVGHFAGPSALGQLAAIGLPACVFALSHRYQGWHAVGKIALLAGLFGGILLVTGSLWIPIALHFGMDLVGVLLGPRLMKP